MLIWSGYTRRLIITAAVLLFALFFLLPLLMILLSALSSQWNSFLPSGLTLSHFSNSLQGSGRDALYSSLVAGFSVSLFALLCGCSAAIAMRRYSGQWKRLLSVIFFLPGAVPSVSVGLGILVAFSQGPLQMNGTLWIVLAAHFVLISAFSFSNISTGLSRIPPDIENVASGLGATAGYCLLRITLPMLMPWMLSALALSLSLSMGELGATMMIYPPGWTTLPVAIFSLSDRGNIADASALTIVLVAVTLCVTVILERTGKRLMNNAPVR